MDMLMQWADYIIKRGGTAIVDKIGCGSQWLGYFRWKYLNRFTNTNAMYLHW